MAQRRDVFGTIVLAALTAGTAVVAGIMLHRGATTWIEAASFVSGAVSVWLTVRESAWNFPIGLVNEVTFFVVCAREKLYADAGLQVIWFVLTGIGWYLWLFGGPGRTPLRVTFTPANRWVKVSVATVVMWAGMYLILRRVGDSAPMVDAFCTAVSLSAQWLLDRKHIDNWAVWFGVDLIYVPLYLSRSLVLSAILYAAFVAMCVIGWRDWRRSMADDEQGLPVIPVADGFPVVMGGDV
jgi:nicotinamide mononucleotide transporter